MRLKIIIIIILLASGLSFVLVGQAQAAGLTIVSPQAGQIWSAGTVQTIIWTPNNVTNPTVSATAPTVYITLNPVSTCSLSTTVSCSAMGTTTPYIVAQNISNSGSFSWAISSSLPEPYVGSDTVNINLSDNSAQVTSGVITIAESGTGSALTSSTSSAASQLSPIISPIVPPVTASTSSPITSSTTTPLSNNSLFLVSGNPTVYLVNNGAYLPFTSAQIFLARGYQWSQIQVIQPNQFNTQNVSPTYALVPNNSLVKSVNSSTIYLVTNNGQKSPIPSMDVFNRLGLGTYPLITLSDNELQNYVTTPPQQ
jgi:hypothetical protein